MEFATTCFLLIFTSLPKLTLTFWWYCLRAFLVWPFVQNFPPSFKNCGCRNWYPLKPPCFRSRKQIHIWCLLHSVYFWHTSHKPLTTLICQKHMYQLFYDLWLLPLAYCHPPSLLLEIRQWWCLPEFLTCVHFESVFCTKHDRGIPQTLFVILVFMGFPRAPWRAFLPKYNFCSFRIGPLDQWFRASSDQPPFLMDAIFFHVLNKYLSKHLAIISIWQDLRLESLCSPSLQSSNWQSQLLK